MAIGKVRSRLGSVVSEAHYHETDYIIERHGKPMAATGAEGIHELELSNAIYIAGYKHKQVDLPVDAAEMERLLTALARQRNTGKSEDIRRRANAELRMLLGKYPT